MRGGKVPSNLDGGRIAERLPMRGEIAQHDRGAGRSRLDRRQPEAFRA